MLSRNGNNKKCALKFLFLNEKKIRKIRKNFDIENWLWKSNIGTFCSSPLLQFSTFCNFILKNIYFEIAKSPPIICPMYCQSNNWWRFRKILWASQNVWTLSKKVAKFIYSEKATKFCEISSNYLTGST